MKVFKYLDQNGNILVLKLDLKVYCKHPLVLPNAAFSSL